MRHAADWWAKRVEEVESGADVAAVARRHGVKPVTLRWWQSELRRRRQRSGPRLLPVVVDRAVTSPPSADGVELVVETQGCRITLRGPFDAALLEAAIRSASGC